MAKDKFKFIWELILEAEQDVDKNRANLKRQVWVKLQAVMPYLTHTQWEDRTLTNQQAAKDFKVKFTAFMTAYKAAWGKAAAIHYHHMCWVHMPVQIEKFGPPFLFSASSLEKSHWKAHGNYHRHTQQVLK